MSGWPEASGTWVALRTGLGTVPDTLRWGQLVGGAGLAGIGFTVALFVTDLAYGSVPSIGVDPAKLAILAASLVAGLLGVAVLFGGRSSPPN